MRILVIFGNKETSMKYLFAIFIVSINQLNLFGQIYDKPMKLEYEVYHILENDTVKSKLHLDCSGKPWKIPNGKNQKFTPQYHWSVTWSSTDKSHIETTGVKITSEEIFLHPPRLLEYSILEFCPFPLVHFPLKVGHTWEWELNNIGDYYHRVLKSKTKSKITVKNKYTVNRKISWLLKATNKYIECFEIIAIGKTAIGESKSTFYYSQLYGFVYLNFETLNGDKYVMTLTKQSINFEEKRLLLPQH